MHRGYEVAIVCISHALDSHGDFWSVSNECDSAVRVLRSFVKFRGTEDDTALACDQTDEPMST